MVGKPVSTAIGSKAAQTSYYAEEQARRIGLPFTHMVTINYAGTSIDPREATASFSRLRRSHYNKWAMRPGKHSGVAYAPTYAFAFENVRDGHAFMTMEPGDPHNVHVHWAVHIPPQRLADFERRLWGWVEATAGLITGGAETIHLARSNAHLGGYLVKGASPATAEFYARGRAATPQGMIIGRRADTSRNLGPTARRALDRELGIRRQIPSRRDHTTPIAALT
jgi:hypothetical protein